MPSIAGKKPETLRVPPTPRDPLRFPVFYKSVGFRDAFPKKA